MKVGIAEIQAIRDYLHSASARTFQRGKRYYRQGRVRSCQFDSESGTLEGQVQGNLNYQAILSYDPNRKQWEGECSCPMTYDCKHCIALAFYLQEHRHNVPSSGNGSQPIEGDTITPDEQGALDELTAYWERKNGKPPTPTQTGHLARIAECYLIWKSGNLSDTYLVNQLSVILRLGSSYYYHRSLKLPERIDPPLSVIEFWHAVLERAIQADFSLSKPKQWQGISEIEEGREALDRLEREEERLTVQNWLTEFAEKPDFLELSNEIQLRIGKRQAVVFVTVPGNRKPLRITATQWAELQTNPFIDPAGQIILTLLNDHVANRGVVELENDYRQSRDALRRLLCLSDARPALRQWDGQPLDWPEEEAAWTLERADDYDLIRLSAGGQWLDPIDLFLPGHPSLAVCDGKVYRTAPAPASWHQPMEEDYEVPLPAGTLCSPGGRKLCRMLQIPFPEDYQAQLRIRSWQVEIQAEMKYSGYGHESISLDCQATTSPDLPGKAAPAPARFTPDGWILPPDLESPPGEGFIENEWNGATDIDRLIAGVRPRFDHYSDRWELPCREDNIAQLAEWAASCKEARVLARGELAALLKPPAHVRLEVEIEESGRDWFDVEARLNCEEEDLTEEEMALLMKGKGRWVRIPRKGWRRIEPVDPETWDDSLAELGITLGQENHTRQRLHALQLAPAAEKDLLDPADARQIRQRINSIRTQVDIDVPDTIRAEMRPYQREGLNFLAYLSSNNFGGILADDMGLGKTLQSLAWLAWLQRRRGKAALPGPTLVVCPKSVVDAWVAEAAKFFPELAAIPVTSAVEDTVIEEADRKALVVMNYAQLRSRRDTLLEREWGAVILDEGQFIKNPASQTARTAFELRSAHRLVLTGTPVENRLTDLWSLMNFAMPGILGNKASFKTLAGDGSNPVALRRVGIRLKPFFLRRTKKAVAADLPERIEEDIFCHLTGEQKKHYDAELKKARLILAKVRSAADFNEARFNILTSLLRLRQLCCHRALVEGTRDPAKVKPSPKLEALGDLLDPLRAEGEKVLIFSQFTSLLDIVAPFVEKQGSPVWTLTGKTNRRQELVDDFRQSDGHAVFLISLKAGGTGLNLTEAPYVVMLDPWWNPAVENQAIDRTHRIGQTRNVIAYRILARDTIEEKIRQRQQDKSRLAESVLGEASGGSALTLDDFRFLLD